jgi:protein-S-isoprenylcysteine O-methyltransferase Ste14
MSTDMTVFGSGRRIAMVAFPALGLTIAAGYVRPGALIFGRLPFPVLLGTGLGLIAIGLAINSLSAAIMMKAFNAGRLETRATYAISRNPMYASFVAFTIPGISLVFNNWTVLIASLVLYYAVSYFVREEEQWLAARFGDDWKAYARRVGRIFPRLGW